MHHRFFKIPQWNMYKLILRITEIKLRRDKSIGQDSKYFKREMFWMLMLAQTSKYYTSPDRNQNFHGKNLSVGPFTCTPKNLFNV